MSCKCSFPPPSVECVVSLVQGIRSGAPVTETLEKALCLVGGGIKLFPMSLEGEELPAEIVEAVQSLEIPGDDADEQVWEIIIPILVPIAIELLKLWIARRQGRR
jgi:hypothetical protein